MNWLSEAVQTNGWPVVAGIDISRATYGQVWNLKAAQDRERLRYLLYVLQPGGVHVALPCTAWCALGASAPNDEDESMAEFSMDLLEHCGASGVLASFEGPRTHGLLHRSAWQDRFGTITEPKGVWRYARPDGCMYRVLSPDEEPLAMKKPYTIMANFDISLIPG